MTERGLIIEALEHLSMVYRDLAALLLTNRQVATGGYSAMMADCQLLKERLGHNLALLEENDG